MQLSRLKNGFRKLLAGLPLGGERVWPGLRNDLFVAHESIYRFFASAVQGREVLDAGCGTGYGTATLAVSGATRVLGTDVSRFAIRYARHRFRHPNLEFRVADCEKMRFSRKYDLIVSSNVLEHLREPAQFIEWSRMSLRVEGLAIVVVPPITHEGHLRDNLRNEHHKSNLTVDQWHELFLSSGFAVELLRHSHDSWRELDFSSWEPSVFVAEDFRFEPVELEAFSSVDSLSAVFRLEPNS